MKVVPIIFITSTLILTGCGVLSASKGTDANSPDAKTESESKKIKAGDPVVAKWSGGSFYEGKVEKVEGAKVTVAWLDKSKATDVDAIDVYAMPAAGARSDVKVGDMVLTKTASTGTYWTGAEVTSIEVDVYKVRPVSSTAVVNVPAEKVIKVSAAVAADFKDKAGATDFLKEAQNARPTVPSDFKPKKGDRVVAEWAAKSWYSGKIDNISGSNIYIAWDDQSKPSAVTADKVLPMPSTTDKGQPTADQFILIKPENGSKWQYAQASGVHGTNVEARLPDGKTRTVKTGEFILLN